MRKGVKGFTLVEVTIILLVLVILGGILLPVLERFIDLARLARVREDIGALAAIVEMFKVDMCDSYFRQDGPNPSVDSDNRVDMLVGDPAWANIPAVDENLDGALANWDEEIDTCGGAFSSGVVVDTIDNHLILGDPFGQFPGAPYIQPDNPLKCGWRGPYMTGPILADPWGNRYMINVAFLGNPSHRAFGLTHRQFAQANVFVLSAGPDEIVQTPWINFTGAPGGDDQIALIKGHSASY